VLYQLSYTPKSNAERLSCPAATEFSAEKMSRWIDRPCRARAYSRSEEVVERRRGPPPHKLPSQQPQIGCPPAPDGSQTFATLQQILTLLHPYSDIPASSY
jgi:hypothetical protein